MKDNSGIRHCDVYKRCSGCQLQNMTYEEQLKFKEIKCVRSLGKYGRVEKIIGMKYPYNYRNKLQTVYRKDKHGRILSGVYQSATQGIVATDKCFLEDKESRKIAADIRNLLRQFRITVYNPHNGTGYLRHVLIRKGFSTGEIMVVLVATSVIFPRKKDFTEMLLSLHPEITTVVLNVNEGNKLTLGEKSIVLFGKGYIEDELLKKRFIISPKSFYQVNPIQTEVLYSKAIELADLKGNETVLDAYCGIGTIGIIASDKVKNVIGVELVKDAIKDAEKNARINNISNIGFYNADAADFLSESVKNELKFDVAFIDPPRAGCDKKFIRKLIESSVKKIVYISCNPETQGRDLFTFTTNGYKVERICPVDMFPWTNHVESVVLLKHNTLIRTPF